MFIVGANKGEDITELERMDSLRGELEIKCLENVKSGRDAEYANLMRKKGIKTLSLTWSRQTEEENERNVIEGLQPDSDLRKLVILEYRGIGFPRWMDYSTLPNLVEISLQCCTRCELPPSLSRLPFLKTLHLDGMPCVKFLLHSEDEDINSDDMVNRFSSLEELKLVEMEELEEWCSFRGKGGGGERRMFLPPRLKKLKIWGCPKLKIVRWSPSLENLSMMGCNEIMLESLRNLPRLSHLDIGWFYEVTDFPEGSLQNLTVLRFFIIHDFEKLRLLPKELGDLCKLTDLTIENCNELVSLPEEMRNLSSLQCLLISRCKKLESLPEVGRSSLIELNIENCERMKNISRVLNGCQTMLQSLSICFCPNLECQSVEFEHLLALRKLYLNINSEMTTLPDGMQNLSSTLQDLTLHVNSMISLPDWLGSLKELQSLHIVGCKKLTTLPEGLRLLTNLKHMRIEVCHPNLHRRCQSRQGEDWHKISHIPHLYIQKDMEAARYR